MNELIEGFLAGGAYAVAGASSDRAKYGNKVLRCYWQHGRVAYPVNPSRSEIEGEPCFPDLRSLPGKVHGVSLITPPAASAQVVADALELGIPYLWFQPGSESPEAISQACARGVRVIHGGPCLLVVLGYRDG